MKNKKKKLRKVNKENKVIDYRTYYLREFQLFDGEVDITFNIVAIDTIKEEITVAVSNRGRISILTYLPQPIYLLLQICEESPGMGAVHLAVVELEGNGQGIPEQLSAITAPEQEGVVENTAVHANNTVELGVDYGGSADDHAVFG